MDRKGRGGKGEVRVLVGKAPGHLELVVKVRVRIYQAFLAIPFLTGLREMDRICVTVVYFTIT